MRPAWRWLLALGLAWLAWAPGWLPALAQAGSVAAERYDVDLTVEDGGALAVVERLTLDFNGGPFRHGYQTIDLTRVEGLHDVQVGEPGQPYQPGSDRPGTFQTSRNSNTLRVDWWFAPTANASRTFELSYRAEGALRVYPDGDQVYWQAIPADLSYPVRQARVLVHLPADVSADQLKLAAYPERLHGTGRQVDPRTVAFETRDLGAGTGLTVRVQFPHGLVTAQPPSWQAAADRADVLAQTVRPALNFVFLVLGLLIPAVGLAGLVLLWRTRGRDPDVAPGAGVVSAPPSDLPAPLAGTLLDERADVQDAVATLVDLGNRGVLRMTQIEEPTPIGPVRDYELERLGTNEAGLREHERLLLLTLFGEANKVRLSRVRGTFAAAIPAIEAALYREVVQEGLFTDNPGVVRSRYRQLGVVLAVVGVVGAIFVGGWLETYSDLGWLPFVGLLALGGVLLALAPHMPQRTRAGALAAQRWRAFRRYLTGLASGRDTAQHDEFQRYLPYAVAFGLDRAWIERFAASGAPAPAWYQGGGPVIIGTPGWYPWGYGGYGGGWGHAGGGAGHAGAGPGGPPGFGGPQQASDSLAEMLGRASDVFSHGGDSGWSGGGFGDFGGSSGGGGGGGGGFS
ncbi:MAG TPA: DUF2207 domain-containing protein [Chloroflexota bacterium]|nr:DUF2207 domain-containing protein [Chloroflexota bacterium]